ncbi:MAG TPA: FtsX-like permease family protein [Candidatus Methanoperedens sp.]
MAVDINAALFYSRKDLLKNKKIFIFITLAIIFATANIIVVNGLMEGMIDDFLDNNVETSIGHLNIYPNQENRYIEGMGIKEQKLATLKEVIAYSPRISANGVLSYKELSASTSILGLYPEKEKGVSKILEKLDKGESLDSNDQNGILVSYRLAEDLKLDIEDEAYLAFENGKYKTYTVKGILRTGNSDFDASTIIMIQDEAARQLAMDNKASVILIKLHDKTLASQYKHVIMQELELSNVKTWREEVEYILSFTVAWKSFTGIISIVGLIAAVISVGLIIYINVVSKKRQIGIMKAIGAKDSFIFTIFVMEAILFGLIGAILGDILGYLAIKYLETHPFYDAVSQTWMSARFYDYILITASAVSFSVTVLAGIYPAVKASKIDIIKAIWGG